MKKQNKLKTIAVSLFQGFSLGTAEIIPGVSGSTIALLFGIYDDFIELLYQASEFIKLCVFLVLGKAKLSDIKKLLASIRWTFGITLGIGMLSAIVLLSSLISYLLVSYPNYLFSMLFGLIPPTLLIVYKQMGKLTPKTAAITILTALGLLGIFALSGSASSATDPHPLYLFMGGMIAISAMVLPGVSGSFMLLVLGLYNFAVGLVADASHGSLTPDQVMNILSLLGGMAVGFVTTVRLLKWAFAKFRSELMAFLLGLLLASWYVLWPFVKITGIDHGEPILQKVSPWSLPDGQLTFSLLIIVGTMVLTTYLHNYADTHDPKSKRDDDGFDRM